MISGKNNGEMNSVYIHYFPHLEEADGGGKMADGRKKRQTEMASFTA